MTDKEITKLINEIFEKTNFVANISIVLPQGDIKVLLDILPNYYELFLDKQMSWRVTNVKNGGIMLEIDKKIEKGYGYATIIVTTNGEYSVSDRDYTDTNVNDTFDVITSPDGHYKSYKIIKDDKNGINQI